MASQFLLLYQSTKVSTLLKRVLLGPPNIGTRYIWQELTRLHLQNQSKGPSCNYCSLRQCVKATSRSSDRLCAHQATSLQHFLKQIITFFGPVSARVKRSRSFSAALSIGQSVNTRSRTVDEMKATALCYSPCNRYLMLMKETPK